MHLNLEPYQARLPYPAIRQIVPDKALAAQLLEGYSGKVSELTTVTQYAYHSLQCRHSHKYISDSIRGIFYVETLHMELLGDCIARLGGDVQYNYGMSEHASCWKADCVDYKSAPIQILQADIAGEKGAVAFYEKMASIARQPEIARLMLRLAEDEKLHIRLFNDLYYHALR